MKHTLLMMVVLVAAVAFAQEKTLSLADARGQIGAVVDRPEMMTSVMKQLSVADQKQFLASVNEAISKLPGSADERAAKFLAVNSAALKGRKNGNLTALVAEIFATVPLEALTVLNERFAAELFNRAADPSKTYTDEQFTTISKNVLAGVQARSATVDKGEIRNVFAIMMMLRASNGTPENLKEVLVSEIKDDSVRKLAQDEWIADGLRSDYESILGASDAGEVPSPDVILQYVSSTALEVLLADLAQEGGVVLGHPSVMEVSPYCEANIGLTRVPRDMDLNLPYDPEYRRGEPWPYEGQTTGLHDYIEKKRNGMK